MIDQPTIDRILDAANIVDVVSEFVTLRKRGINYVGLCPFHSDKSPSFYVSPAKNICKCFACGEGGTAVHFIMKHEQLSYYDALRFLAKKYNIEIQERELSEREKQVRSDRESMLIVNSWAQKYFTTQLYEHQEGKAAGLRYFAERGFREDTIRKFQLGYSLDQRDALYKAATKSGYKKEFLEKTGLVIAYDNGGGNDRFRGRVIFPVHTLSGKVVAFGGRAQNVRSKLRILHFASRIQIYLGEGGRDKKPAFLRQTLSNGLCCADLFVHIPRAKKLHTAFLIFESAESACLPYQNSIFIIL